MKVHFDKVSKYLRPYIKSLSDNEAFGDFNEAFLVKRCIIKANHEDNICQEDVNSILVIVETNNDDLTFLISIAIDSDGKFKILSIIVDEYNLLMKLRRPSNIITNESKLYYIEMNHLESPKLKIVKGNSVYMIDIRSDFNDNDYSELKTN